MILDTSQLCRTGHDDVPRTKMRDPALMLLELSPFDASLCIFVPALKFEYLWNIIMILHLWRTGLDDVLRTRMITLILTFIHSELFPLDVFRCNFMFAP